MPDSTSLRRRRHPADRAHLSRLAFLAAAAGIACVPICLLLGRMWAAAAEGELLSSIIERSRSISQSLMIGYKESLPGTVTADADGKAFQFLAKGGRGYAPRPIRYEIRLAEGERANEADDDGDGLVDEGSLVCIDASRGVQVVLAEMLDAGSSRFQLDGDGVHATIVILGRSGGPGDPPSGYRAVTFLPKR